MRSSTTPTTSVASPTLSTTSRTPTGPTALARAGRRLHVVDHLRAHQAQRRPGGDQAGPRRDRRPGHPRGSLAGPARADAQGVPGGPGPCSRGDRRRGTRHPRRRRVDRHPLRPPGELRRTTCTAREGRPGPGPTGPSLRSSRPSSGRPPTACCARSASMSPTPTVSASLSTRAVKVLGRPATASDAGGRPRAPAGIGAVPRRRPAADDPRGTADPAPPTRLHRVDPPTTRHGVRWPL